MGPLQWWLASRPRTACLVPVKQSRFLGSARIPNHRSTVDSTLDARRSIQRRRATGITEAVIDSRTNPAVRKRPSDKGRHSTAERPYAPDEECLHWHRWASEAGQLRRKCPVASRPTVLTSRVAQPPSNLFFARHHLCRRLGLRWAFQFLARRMQGRKAEGFTFRACGTHGSQTSALFMATTGQEGDRESPEARSQLETV